MPIYSSPLHSTPSIWLGEPYRPRESLKENHTCDVAILGGGIVGVSTAYFLARKKIGRIALLEANTIASGATGNNAGMLSVDRGCDYGRWCDSPQRRAIAKTTLEISERTQRLIRDIIAEHRIPCDYRQSGCAWVPTDEEGEVVARLSLLSMQQDGFTVRELTQDDLKELYPHARGLHAGYTFPNHGELHSAQYVRGLANVAEKEGVTIWEHSPVHTFHPHANGVHLQSTNGMLDCGDAVLACNAYLAKLLPSIISIMKTYRGQMIATIAPQEQLMHMPLCSETKGKRPIYYGRPLPSGPIIFGGGRGEVWEHEEQHALDMDAMEPVQGAIASYLRRYFPKIAELPITHRWGGAMAETKDTMPLIGPLSEYPHTTVVAGMSGNGMGAWGTASAEFYAECMAHGGHEAPHPLFDPKRFGL